MSHPFGKLDFDVLQVAAGAIFRFSPSVEMNLAYQRTVLGRNLAEAQQVFISIAVRRSFLPPPPAPGEANASEER